MKVIDMLGRTIAQLEQQQAQKDQVIEALQQQLTEALTRRVERIEGEVGEMVQEEASPRGRRKGLGT